jgi:hypothetical protein
MLEIRTFRLVNGHCVVALRGDLGLESAAELAAEVATLRGGTVIVDLLRARLVDRNALAALVGAVGSDATYVASRPLLDTLQLVAPNSVSTLAAALP